MKSATKNINKAYYFSGRRILNSGRKGLADWERNLIRYYLQNYVDLFNQYRRPKSYSFKG